ncbi:MAG: hypothetical protein OEV60_05730 [Actinomycetota bacterium]|nr:hypothetical protein [Actinomycetota bacterium]MDH5224787.1 hypothetical protein [Actinomycetota bacterium]MDH5313525.1 hypothetical protein [Actinomycetota bacterium]
MAVDDVAPEILGADAAHAATEATVDAIDEAAKVNDDPEVAEALEEASVQADQAASRTGWLRRMLHRRAAKRPG